MAQEFTGADFTKALAAGTLTDHILREGMAKQNENDPQSILFTEGLDCTNWFPIPVKMIEKVEFLRNVPCKGHQHPYVRIHLKSPTGNPEAEVFSRLLAASSPGHLRLAGAELAPLAAWPSQQPIPGGFVSPANPLSSQSSGTPTPGQSICGIYCTWEESTMTIAVATGSGGISWKTITVWVKVCVPIVCSPR